MFGFNWGELIVIGIVALIAIGPKELPTVLRTLGHWMGKVRRMANEFQSQFQEALREAEFADLKKHADEISSSMQEIGRIEPISEIQKDVEHAFAETPAAAPASEPAAEALPAPVPEAPTRLPEIEVPPPEPPATIATEDLAPPAQKAGGSA